MSPLGESVRNALVSYVSYIGQMFWPAGLAVFYPYRTSVDAVARRLRARHNLRRFRLGSPSRWRTRPYLATGWFWYLGTLVPVIGLMQVGFQSHADRYMYVPMVGLSVILAWGAADVVRKWPQAKFAIASLAVVSLLACLVPRRRKRNTGATASRFFNAPSACRKTTTWRSTIWPIT